MHDGQPVAHRGRSSSRDPNLNPNPPNPNRRLQSRSPPTTTAPAGGSNLVPLEAAKFDAALQSHHDALIAEWKRDHQKDDSPSDHRPPLPGTGAAFMRLVEAGWDADVARRPHGQHTTVVVHLDVEQRAAQLHLGPLLSEADRQYLGCDATCEVWFERDGQVIGAGRDYTPNQSSASPCARAPRPHVCGAWLWGYPGFTRPPPAALGRRRPRRLLTNLVLRLPPPSPVTPSGRHHHHRARARGHRHRQRRPSAESSRAGPPTKPAAARGSTMPRAHRQTRPLEVVSTLPTPSTTDGQLGWLPRQVITRTTSTPKKLETSRSSSALLRHREGRHKHDPERVVPRCRRIGSQQSARRRPRQATIPAVEPRGPAGQQHTGERADDTLQALRDGA